MYSNLFTWTFQLQWNIKVNFKTEIVSSHGLYFLQHDRTKSNIAA